MDSQIESRTKELQRLNRDLKNSNEELSRFASIASHDLKEPLRNISTFAALIDRKVDNSNSLELREYAQFVSSNAQQLYKLVQDILTYSTFNQENSHRLEPVDMNLITFEIEKALSQVLIEKKGVISCPSLPVIQGNHSYLYLIFQNLIENGLKYNQSITPYVSVHYEREWGHHHFIVEDNGIGISENHQCKIFEMFSRLHSKDEYEGSGLGLAITQKMIARLEGTISVESYVGKGSKFHVRLPFQE